MKKMILCIWAILLVLSLFACTDISPKPNGNSSNGTNNSEGESGESNNGSNTENNGSNQEKKKISGAIEAGTVFSDGLALVRLVGDENTIYCIDKEGYIVFEADTESGSLGTGFHNGYAIISGKIYDRTGKSTAPEDVGATEFRLTAAEDGYILATKITSDFSGTKKEFGILDENFDWIVSPSEELYQVFSNDYDDLSVKYSNHYLYNLNNGYLNILTGEILEAEPEDFVSDPTDIALEYYSDGTYRDKDDHIVIDLREYNTLVRGWSFVNGKAVILFKNTISQHEDKYYYTIIDKAGVFAFEPVEIDLRYVGDMHFDGEYVVFQDRMLMTSTYTTNYVCYNADGELEGKIAFARSIYLHEGVILAGSTYYNPDFTPLFE